ncbi:hypothetical protein [Pyruvatibacter sp.]|uniref:hypothetical protein n=1 Tax=Pyruvatibacter sp. TaxID=1981328 RepID=UPI0032EBCD21
MRTVLGYLLAVIVMLVLGAGAHAVFNQGDLAALGAEFSIGERLSWIAHDIAGMAPLYGAIMGGALLIGFIVAGIVAGFITPLRTIIYMVAGAVAVGVALTAMSQLFEITPITSTRDIDGMIGQLVAGALAGLAYVSVKRSTA